MNTFLERPSKSVSVLSKIRAGRFLPTRLCLGRVQFQRGLRFKSLFFYLTEEDKRR